jgi:hypothetical protein
MSTILEALRRLQTEREDGERPGPSDSLAVAAPVPIERSSGRGRTLVLVCAMALVGTAGGAYMAAWIFSRTSSDGELMASAEDAVGVEDGAGSNRPRSPRTRDVSTAAAIPSRSLREGEPQPGEGGGTELSQSDQGELGSAFDDENPTNYMGPEPTPLDEASAAGEALETPPVDPAAQLAASAAARGSGAGAVSDPSPIVETAPSDPLTASEPPSSAPVAEPTPPAQPEAATAPLPAPAPEAVALAPVAPMPAAEPPAPAPVPAAAVPPAAVAPSRPVQRQKPVQPKKPAEEALDDPIAFPELSVTKVSWHPDPKRRQAMVRVDGSAPQDAREGDLIDGVLLTRIAPGEVEFRVGERSRVVRLGK